MYHLRSRYNGFYFTVWMFALCCINTGCTSNILEQTVTRIEYAQGVIDVRYIENTDASKVSSHTIRFYFIKDGHQRLLVETMFNVNGRSPAADNILHKRNLDGTLSVGLHAEGQADAVWVFESVEGSISMMLVGSCS